MGSSPSKNRYQGELSIRVWHIAENIIRKNIDVESKGHLYLAMSDFTKMGKGAFGVVFRVTLSVQAQEIFGRSEIASQQGIVKFFFQRRSFHRETIVNYLILRLGAVDDVPQFSPSYLPLLSPNVVGAIAATSFPNGAVGLPQPGAENFKGAIVQSIARRENIYSLNEYITRLWFQKNIMRRDRQMVARMVLLHVVHGMTMLHAIGVFHRDIHPGNIIIARANRPLSYQWGNMIFEQKMHGQYMEGHFASIIDFGKAAILGRGSSILGEDVYFPVTWRPPELIFFPRIRENISLEDGVIDRLFKQDSEEFFAKMRHISQLPVYTEKFTQASDIYSLGLLVMFIVVEVREGAKRPDKFYVPLASELLPYFRTGFSAMFRTLRPSHHAARTWLRVFGVERAEEERGQWLSEYVAKMIAFWGIAKFNRFSANKTSSPIVVMTRAILRYIQRKNPPLHARAVNGATEEWARIHRLDPSVRAFVLRYASLIPEERLNTRFAQRWKRTASILADAFFSPLRVGVAHNPIVFTDMSALEERSVRYVSDMQEKYGVDDHHLERFLSKYAEELIPKMGKFEQ